MHGVQTTLEDLLETHVPALLTAYSLLRSRSLIMPLVRVIGNRHILLQLLLLLTHLLARLYTNKLSEPVYLGEDHLPHLTNVLDNLEVEVERLRARGLV